MARHDRVELVYFSQSKSQVSSSMRQTAKSEAKDYCQILGKTKVLVKIYKWNAHAVCLRIF